MLRIIKERLKLRSKQHDIGVIIGRFQVDDLHDAHLQLIENVCDRHERIMICVGVSPTLGNKENPLDFPTREAMINSYFKDGNIIVVPLLDNSSNEVWSSNLDTLIRTVYPLGRVCLYGGRSSFIDSYKGQFDTYEFPHIDHKPATEIRAEIGRDVRSSNDFRRGIIYSTQNQFPKVYSTVDIAIVDSLQKPVIVLLGRKKDQKDWRFPGGFLDQKETLEDAARREAFEETGCKLSEVKYEKSFVIDDWRYRKTSDSILTSFFIAQYLKDFTKEPKAGDDLEEIKWFDINELVFSQIRGEHQKMFQILLDLRKVKGY